MTSLRTASAILVAGGMGTRLGKAEPKAFVPLGGRPLFTWALDILAAHPSVAEIVIVVPAGYEDSTAAVASDFLNGKRMAVVPGGAERWQSVEHGVAACTGETDWILVHDAARPFVSPGVIDDVLGLADRFLCGFTATPEVDTIRRYAEDRCTETLDRSRILRVGTPQLFHKQTLREGLAAASTMVPPPTDEAMLFESLGHPLGFAWGDPLNFKVTTPSDFAIAEAVMLARQSAAPHPRE